jgi:hypothetical protein
MDAGALREKHNLESWSEVLQSYEEDLQEPGWDWLQGFLPLVKRLATSDRARHFRAGRSLSRLLISTKTEHGLDDEDPFVAVVPRPQAPTEVIYVHARTRHPEKQLCDEDSLPASIEAVLDHL